MGWLEFCLFGFSHHRRHLHPLHALLRSMAGSGLDTPWPSLNLSQEVSAAFLHWQTKLRLCSGRPLQQSLPEIVLTTDSSPHGWGAVLSNLDGTPALPPPLHEAAGVWMGEQRELHQNEQEMLGVECGLRSFPDQIRGKHLLVETDNGTVASYLLREGGRRPLLRRMTARIFDSGLFRSLQVRWLSSKDNAHADALSRLAPDRWAITVAGAWVDRICNRFGVKPTVDAFATIHNTRFPRFFSRFAQPTAAGQDAFLQDWRSEECLWAFPPRFAAAGARQGEGGVGDDGVNRAGLEFTAGISLAPPAGLLDLARRHPERLFSPGSWGDVDGDGLEVLGLLYRRWWSTNLISPPPAQVVRRLLLSVLPSTLSALARGVADFAYFCAETDSDPFAFEPNVVLAFIEANVAAGRYASFSKVKTVRAAVGMLAVALGIDRPSGDTISQYMTAIRKANPSKVRSELWDPARVFSFLASEWADNGSLSYGDLRAKAIFLLGFYLFARADDLASIDVGLSVLDSDVELSIVFRGTKGNPASHVTQAFPVVALGPAQAAVCPVRAWGEYRRRLLGSFSAALAVDTNPLGIFYPLPGRGTSPVQSATIARQIVGVLNAAGVFGHTAHSLRAVAATAAQQSGIATDAVVAHGRWGSAAVAETHYLRPKFRFMAGVMADLGSSSN